MHPHLAESRHCPHCAAALGRAVPPDEDRERLVCTGCGFVLYLGPQVAAGTAPMVDGQLVLIRRGVNPRRGFWSFPCGYVELYETCEQAAVRETREECGLEVEVEGHLGTYSYPFPRRPEGRVVIVSYSARIVGGTLEAGDDADEVRLFAPDAVPWDDLAFESSTDTLRDLLARQ